MRRECSCRIDERGRDARTENGKQIPRADDALAAPMAAHARHDHRSARAIFLLVVSITDPHGIRTGIVRAAIDGNAPRRAANDPAALRGKFLGGQSVGGHGDQRRLGARYARRRQNDQAREKAKENCRSPNHGSPSRTLVPRQRLRLRRAGQHQEIVRPMLACAFEDALKALGPGGQSL